AAITATEAGARVALMESNVVGGTCVNVGCVPSKAMLAPAEAYLRAGHQPFAGVRTSADGFDLAAMVDSKTELVDQLRAEKYMDLPASTALPYVPGGRSSSALRASPATAGGSGRAITSSPPAPRRLFLQSLASGMPDT